MTGLYGYLRGGSWNNGYADDFRAANRFSLQASFRDDNFGFRCAASTPSSQVLRGGSWFNGGGGARADSRFNLGGPAFRGDYDGFRCAVST